MNDEQTLEEWIQSRPPAVRKLALEFPLGTRISFHEEGELFYVIGYTEGGDLVVSKIDPDKDFAAAVANKELLCAHCIRTQIVTTH